MDGDREVVVHVLAPRANRGALAIIYAVVMLDLLGFGILLPAATYIVRQYNTDALAVSVIFALYPASQILAAPILGNLSDRFGRRPVLLISIAGSAIGYFLFGIGGAIWVLFLARVIDGITGGNLSTASAYIADITPGGDRARNFAGMGAAFGIGLMLGPVVGGALTESNLSAPAFAAGIFSLLSAMVGFFLLPESLPKERRTSGPVRWEEVNPFASMAHVLRISGLGRELLAFGLFNYTFAGLVSVLPVFAIERFNIQPLPLTELFVLCGIAMLVVQTVLVTPLARRFGDRRLAAVTLLVLSISTVCLPFASDLWMIYPLLVLSVGTMAVIWPTLAALIAGAAPSGELGKVSGITISLGGLMNVVGPLGAGAAYDLLGNSTPFWISALLLVFSGLVIAAAPSKFLLRLDGSPPRR